MQTNFQNIRQWLETGSISAKQRDMLVGILLLAMIVLFWIPFGFKTTDIAEGWSNLDRANNSGWFYLSNGRPMVMLPWEMAALISRDSFVGAQLVLMALFWGKAFCLYLIVRTTRLMKSSVAFFMAVLFVIYPADTGLFTLRALGRHSAVFFYLLATMFLLLSCKYEKKKIYPVLMVIAHAIACFTAEAGALLALATPTILWLYPQCSRTRKFFLLISWYVILAASLVFIVMIGAGYQTMRFESGFSSKFLLIESVIQSNLNAYWLAFIKAWGLALGRLKSALPYLSYALAIAFILALGMAALNRMKKDDEDDDLDVPRRFWFLLVTGFLIFGLGFGPYSVTDLRYETWRVFYYAAMGPSLVLTLLVTWVAQQFQALQNKVFIVVSVGIVFLATMSGLLQHSEFVDTSRRQQRALSSLAEQVPHAQKWTTFIFLVDQEGHSPLQNDSVNGRVLTWLYQGDGGKYKGITCYASRNNCKYTISSVQFTSIFSDTERLNATYSYRSALFFGYDNKSGDIILLEEIPPDLLENHIVADGYNPYRRIIYFPFPARPQKAFVSELSPNPLDVAPKDWVGDNLTMDNRRVCDTARTERCSLHLQGGHKTSPSFSQEIKINGHAGQTAKLRLWGKVESLTAVGPPPQASITFVNADGTTTQSILLLDGLSSDWSLANLKTVAAKPFTSILVKLEGGLGSWSVWMDTIKLRLDDVFLPLLNPSFEVGIR